MAITTNIFDLEDVMRGDTFIHQITVKNTDETAKDISAANPIRYTIRQHNYDGAIVYQKTLGGGVAITNGAGGILQVTIPDTEMATLSPSNRYVYDCELVIGGQRCTVQIGRLNIKADVSYPIS